MYFHNHRVIWAVSIGSQRQEKEGWNYSLYESIYCKIERDTQGQGTTEVDRKTAPVLLNSLLIPSKDMLLHKLLVWGTNWIKFSTQFLKVSYCSWPLCSHRLPHGHQYAVPQSCLSLTTYTWLAATQISSVYSHLKMETIIQCFLIKVEYRFCVSVKVIFKVLKDVKTSSLQIFESIQVKYPVTILKK